MSAIFGVNGSQILYNLAFTLGGTGVVLWAVFRFGVHKAIEEHMVEIRTELRPLVEDVQRIKYQVYNNGGESMKDAIDRTEREVIELKMNQVKIMTILEAKPKRTRSK